MDTSYRKLKGRIVEKYDTQAKFARVVGLSANSMSNKMTGRIGFSQEDVVLWCRLLDIKRDEIGAFFYPEIDS